MNAKPIAKALRAELKKKFPAYTFSVTSDYSHMTVALMSGPVWPWLDKTCEGYDQINHYYLDHHYSDIMTPTVLNMLKKVSKIANKDNYSKSDLMNDHVDVGYYFSLHIGKWNKPYEIK